MIAPSLLKNKLTMKCAAENWCYTQTTTKKISYVWTINYFNFYGQEADDSLESSTFSDENDTIKWRLKVFPKAQDQESKDYVSLYLCLVSSNRDKVRANFKLSILNTEGKKMMCVGFTDFHTFVKGSYWGWKKYIKRDTLFNRANGLLSNGELTIYCEIDQFVDVINISGKNNASALKLPKCNLSEDMEKLFENKKFSDIILSVNGQEFYAHKAILAARSPVFAAMFEYETKENKHSKIKISDIDPDTIQEMLRFIYTGKAPCSDEIADKLFAAADKYDIDGLKILCEKALCDSMTIETAASVLILADSHNADELKVHAIDYVVLHVTDVMATCGWDTLIMQHSHLLKEILQAVASQHVEPPQKQIKLS